jgi:hypothetical protein
MGHDPKRRKPTRDDITDTIPGLLTLFRRGAGLLIPSSLAEGSARTLPDGSSTELPTKEPTGVVGVTTGRSEAEGLDSHQGQRPCPPRSRCKRDSGSRLDRHQGQRVDAPGRRRGGGAGLRSSLRRLAIRSCGAHFHMRAGFQPLRIVSRMVSYVLPSSRAAVIAGTSTAS